jgi:hypothetical protein
VVVGCDGALTDNRETSTHVTPAYPSEVPADAIKSDWLRVTVIVVIALVLAGLAVGAAIWWFNDAINSIEI